MTKKELEVQVHQVLDRMRQVKRLHPVLTHPFMSLFIKGDRIQPFMHQMETQAAKLSIIAHIRQVYAQTLPDAVIVAFESYVVEADSGEVLETAPSKDPRRVDALVVEGACEEGTVIVYQTYTMSTITAFPDITFRPLSDLKVEEHVSVFLGGLFQRRTLNS